MIYFLVPLMLGVMGALSGKTEKSKKIFLTVSFFIIWMLAGLRASTVGNDTQAYINIFNNINNGGSFFSPYDGIEYGYVLLCRLIGIFSKNPQVMLLVTSGLTLLPIAITINKHSKNVTVSVILFCFSGFFFSIFSGIRIALCTAILFLAFGAIKDKKPIKFLLLVALATMFHNLGIVFLIAYPLSNIRINGKITAAIIIMSALILIAMPLLMRLVVMVFPKYSAYVDSSYTDGIKLGTIINMAVMLTVYILCFIYRSELIGGLLYCNRMPRLSYVTNSKKEKCRAIKERYGSAELRMGNVMLTFFTLSFAFQVLELGFTLLERCTNMFFYFIILFVPFFGERIVNKNQRKWFYACTIAVLVFKALIITIFRPEWYNIVPYNFFF